MNFKYQLIVCLALFGVASSRPQKKNLNLEAIGEQEIKIREKRKNDLPIFRKLEESGIGSTKNSAPEKNEVDVAKIKLVEARKEPTPSKLVEESKELMPSKARDEQSPEVPDVKDEPLTRTKKQSPNNVCIKIGSCGKTVCGPVVSARGPVVGDVRAMMQNSKMMPLSDVHTPNMEDLNQVASKVESYSPIQSRTFDLMSVSPLPVSPLGYAASAPVESNALGYGHTFLKPPSVPSIPAISTVPVVISQRPPHSLLHPWLLPHLMPHLMPALVPSLASFVTPHRFEPQRYPEVAQNDVKQPLPLLPQPTYVAAENALLCQPFRNQRFESPYEFAYKPEIAFDKSLNVSEAGKSSQNNMDEEVKIKEHLRKVNEIKEEISQLNRAAQKIVDQQERLTEMQQKQLWGTSSSSSMMQGSNQMASSPYMGSGYYTPPVTPWGYSRSSILSYPNSHDDIDFFMNLLRAGKKFGIISDTFQPLTNNKEVQESDSNQKKDMTENTSTNNKSEEIKSRKK